MSNQILFFGFTKEATSSAFVTSYLHYFPSPISGLCILLLSPSSQQNHHFFFSPSLSHPQGETHTPPFTLSTTQQIAFHHGTQNLIFFYFSVSLSPFKLTRGKDQCLFWNRAPEKQMLRKCLLTFVGSQMMNHVPDQTYGRKDGRCGRMEDVEGEEEYRKKKKSWKWETRRTGKKLYKPIPHLLNTGSAWHTQDNSTSFNFPIHSNV